MNQLLIKDEKFEINKNKTKEIFFLKMVNHYLGIKFLPLPFLWHYENFTEPFPIYGVKKIGIYELKFLIKNTNNTNLLLNLTDLNDFNTDVYIIAQYKKETLLYTGVSKDELYLSYHSLLFNNLTKSFNINDNKISLKFSF